MIIKVKDRWINPDLVESIRPLFAGERSQVTMQSGDVHEIALPPDEVAKLINDAMWPPRRLIAGLPD